MNKITEKMTGDKEFIQKQYLKIHHQNQQEYAEEYIRKNRNKVQYTMILFGILIFVQIIKAMVFSTTPFIIDGNYVNGIKKPVQGTFSTELIVEMDDGESVITRRIPIKLTQDDKKEAEAGPAKTMNIDALKSGQAEYQLKNRLQELIQAENNVLELPVTLNEDIDLRWRVETNQGILITGILFLVCMILIYLTRYHDVQKMKIECKESVETELPEFTSKIVLLLNAGLIFHTAFQRILKRELEKETSTYFMKQMLGVQKRVEETNSSLIVELRSFALATEVREFIRLVSMIEDNIKKGAVLAEKMERESELLLEARKKNLQEKIRISETKLTFPMAIQLIVLIGITIAPAMI